MQQIKAYTAQLVTGIATTSIGVYLFHTAKYAPYSLSTTTLFLIFGLILGFGGALVAVDSIYTDKKG